MPKRHLSLRERRLDIPVLINHFIERSATRSGRRITLSSDALDALLRYRWPGNVRELENTIERLTLFSPAGFVELGDLPPQIQGVPTTREAALEILASDGFRSGQYSTSFLEDTHLSAVGIA